MNAHPRPARRNRALPIVAVVAVVVIMTMCTVGTSGPLSKAVPLGVGGGAAAAAVWAMRRWRADRAAYERRLTAWAATEAVLAERLRIARDLHDLVSHGLGLITVRAAATRHLPQSGEMRAALGDIEQTSRDATTELRRMLTVLRDPAAPGPRAPTEGLEALPDIVRAAETAGLRPRLTVDPLGEVPPGVQVAICRTVREGLANTARHAGPVAVTVRVRRDGPVVVVSVADTGPAGSGLASTGPAGSGLAGTGPAGTGPAGTGPAGAWRSMPGAGHGLAGLRERVGSLGGTLTAEPVDGGFRLVARIPAGEPR